MRFEGVPHRRDGKVGLIDKAVLPVRDVFRMPMFWANNHIVSETTFSLDTTSKKIAAIYRAFKAGTIYNILIGFRGGAVTTPNVVYRASIQTVTAAASTSSFPQPSGTLWATGTEGTYTHNALNEIFQSVRLGTGATVAQGDYFAVVLDYSSGTPSGSNYLKVGLEGNTVQTAIHGFPIAMTNTSGSWTQGNKQLPILGFSYANQDNMPSIGTLEDESWSAAPISKITSGEYTLTSTGADKVMGTYWTQPIDAVINGFVIVARFASENTPFDVKLYDVYAAGYDTDWPASSTLISSQSFNSGTVSVNWSTDQYIWLPFPESKVRARQYYAMIVEPTSATAMYVRALHHSLASIRTRYWGSGMLCVTNSSVPTLVDGNSTSGNFIFRYSGFVIPLLKSVTNRRYY